MRNQERIGRRAFMRSGAAAAAGLGAGSSIAAECGDEPSPGIYRQPARDVPIVEQADVVVCGAGPAGVSAAIAAARTGAKTRLIEVNGCLGGIWTAGLLSWIIDASNKSGIMKEMLARLDKRGVLTPFGGSFGYDIERMKLVLEEMCAEAGVNIQLHTRVVAAARNEANRLTMAVTESKSGRQAFAGKVFVDATGDGDLAARAGCQFDYGRKGSGQAQPMSLIVLLTGLDPDEVAPFVRGLAEPRGLKNPKGRLLEEMRRAGVDPSYAGPTIFHIAPGLFAMMANHEYGVAGTDAAQVTAATLSGRAEVNRLVDGLRSLGGVWKNILLVATPEHIGVREGRRIHGRYQVTSDDLVQGARHEDAVCRSTFGVDIHAPDPKKSKGIVKDGVRKTRAYDIPYRALIARDVDGLLTAGRCISGDFVAHSSYRVTGNAVAMGRAAGTAAALAAAGNRLPQDVPWAEIAKKLQ